MGALHCLYLVERVISQLQMAYLTKVANLDYLSDDSSH